MKEQYPYFSYSKSKYLGAEFENGMEQRVPYEDFSYKADENFADGGEYYQRFKALCSQLKPFHLKELEMLKKDSKYPYKSVSKPMLRKDECAACHDSGKNSVASHIPFNDPSQWSEERRQSLWNSIKYMTKSDLKPAHEGGFRMPLGGRPMNDKELEALKDYILKGE